MRLVPGFSVIFKAMQLRPRRYWLMLPPWFRHLSTSSSKPALTATTHLKGALCRSSSIG